MSRIRRVRWEQRTPRAESDDPAADAHATGRFDYQGTTYYFCHPRCLEKFRAAPETYLAAAAEASATGRATMTHASQSHQASASPGETYVCPMHPQIVRTEPGSCPICGMALEPRTVTLEEEANPELVQMTRRFWISVVLTVPVIVAGMGDMIPGLRGLLNGRGRAILELILATPVVVWGGWPFFERAWSSIVNRSLNMFT